MCVGHGHRLSFHRLGVLVYIRPHGFDLDYVNFTSGETGYHTGPTPVN